MKRVFNIKWLCRGCCKWHEVLANKVELVKLLDEQSECFIQMVITDNTEDIISIENYNERNFAGLIQPIDLNKYFCK